MSAALVIEDGTGVAGADALVDEAYVQTYAADRGLALHGDPTAEALRAVIRRAQDWLEGQEGRFPGRRSFPARQTLAFPRDFLDAHGEVRSADIPAEARQAVAAMAVALLMPEAAASGTNTTSPDGLTRKDVQVGSIKISKTYAEGAPSGDAIRDTSAADALLYRVTKLGKSLGNVRFVQPW